MSIKRKLILIGICIAIILVVFTVNVMRRMREDKPEEFEGVTVKENVITRAEAYRLLSYLDYNKTNRELLPTGITYAKGDMSGWYDSYVNAVWKMGLIEGNITITPTEALTYGSCKDLIDKLILRSPDFQSVYSGLTFDFVKAEEDMLITEFLEVYEAILRAVPEEKLMVKEETILVLGQEISEDGKDRIVTDRGKYYYQNTQSYEKYIEELRLKQSDASITGEPLLTPGAVTPTATEAMKADNLNENLVTKYMDKGIRALVCDQELIYVTSLHKESIIVPNVWIIKGDGLQVDAFVGGINKAFQSKYKLSNNIEKVIGDITVQDEKIIQISVKPDMIQGKVLQSSDNFIEVEGYGKIPLEENYKIYKLYGELSMEPTGSILVGYENTDFIVSGGKISAALITESIKAENIRVLLYNTGFKSYYHNSVQFTANSDFTVSGKDKEASYVAGDIVTITLTDEILEEGRIVIKTASDNAKIELLSVERSEGHPKYRGRIEIDKEEDGLLIINELPLEEYLYSVIPSEMPTYYGQEALKVQAVCARSYAYRHLLGNSLSTYGAHVDDSASYQVYNNIPENEESLLAVKDTYGEVIEYDNEVITAYYFSTSCGHTTEPGNVWANDVTLPYINGKLILVEEEGEGAEAQSDAAVLYQDLSTEEKFKSFLEDKKMITYDSGFNWYRWKVTMNSKDVRKVIDHNLASRYAANPDLILTMTEEAKEGQEAVFTSIPVDTVGTLEDVRVNKRESDGIVSELLIIGSKNTVLVKKEYNIRCLLAPVYDTLIRQDDSEIENMNLLPSAYFIIDKKEKDNKLSSITLSGGGYGHGVGMSQNGVKALADAGKKYEDIVLYFYEGTDMGFIYD